MIATCKSKKLTALAAVLLSLLMLLSLSVLPAYAEEADTSSADTSAEITVADTGDTTEPGTEAGTDEAGTGADTDAGTDADTSESTTAAETESDTSALAEEKKEKRTRGFINLGVGAVILIVLIVLCIKFRDKIPAWLKALKSECGKISWCSKDKLKKNTIVVVIIIVSIAIAIGVLDFVFSRGMMLLNDLFH